MITFSCGNCQATFTVDGSMAGKSGPCRSCGNLIQVPRKDATPKFSDLNFSSIDHSPTRKRKRTPKDPLAFAATLALGVSMGIGGTLGYLHYSKPSSRDAEAKGREIGEAFKKGVSEALPGLITSRPSQDTEGTTLFASDAVRLALIQTEYATRYKLTGILHSMYLDCENAIAVGAALKKADVVSKAARSRTPIEQTPLDAGVYEVKFFIGDSGEFRALIMPKDSFSVTSAVSLNLESVKAISPLLLNAKTACK